MQEIVKLILKLNIIKYLQKKSLFKWKVKSQGGLLYDTIYYICVYIRGGGSFTFQRWNVGRGTRYEASSLPLDGLPLGAWCFLYFFLFFLLFSHLNCHLPLHPLSLHLPPPPHIARFFVQQQKTHTHTHCKP